VKWEKRVSKQNDGSFCNHFGSRHRSASHSLCLCHWRRTTSQRGNPLSLLSFGFFDSTLKSDSFSVFRRRCSPTSTTTEPSALTPPTPPPSMASLPSLSCSSARPSSTPSLDAYAAAKGLFPVARPLAPSSPSSSPGNTQLSELIALSSNFASKQLNPYQFIS